MKIIRTKLFSFSLTKEDERKIKLLKARIKRLDDTVKAYPAWAKEEGLDKELEECRKDFEDINTGKPVLAPYQKDYLKQYGKKTKITEKDLFELSKNSPKHDDPFKISEMWAAVDYNNRLLSSGNTIDLEGHDYSEDIKKQISKDTKILNKVDPKGKFRQKAFGAIGIANKAAKNAFQTKIGQRYAYDTRRVIGDSVAKRISRAQGVRGGFGVDRVSTRVSGGSPIMTRLKQETGSINERINQRAAIKAGVLEKMPGSSASLVQAPYEKWMYGAKFKGNATNANILEATRKGSLLKK